MVPVWLLNFWFELASTSRPTGFFRKADWSYFGSLNPLTTSPGSGDASGTPYPGKLQIGVLSQWYEPEPVTIPAVLARELKRRSHNVKVLTGFPNFPTGRIYDGYRVRSRGDDVVSDIPVRRVALFANHGASGLGRLMNYASFAVCASAFGVSWFHEIDALWVYNSPPTVGLPTWLVKARYRPQVVMHVMDLWPESVRASGFWKTMLGHSLPRSALDRWLNSTYETADAIACTSRSQVQILLERGVPARKLSYVPLWTDEAIFFPMPRDEALATELGVSGKVVLLYAGALGEPQGIDTLIEACARLTDEPRFHCLIAGSGIAEQRLRSLAREKHLANVTFLGRWPITDMSRLMSVGDVHFVSLRSDPLAGFAVPSKLPATLAAGKPAIVAARGDAASIVERANAGWVCPPGDSKSLERAIRHVVSSRAEALAAAGRRSRTAYEAEFSLHSSVDRLERLFRGLPSESSHAA